eukprot:m.90180 g.90180  ORF g.90180 m.90180 type:complete len:138 (+) comp51089_c0_seq2:155-568(+)
MASEAAQQPSTAEAMFQPPREQFARLDSRHFAAGRIVLVRPCANVLPAASIAFPQFSQASLHVQYASAPAQVHEEPPTISQIPIDAPNVPAVTSRLSARSVSTSAAGESTEEDLFSYSRLPRRKPSRGPSRSRTDAD